MIDPLIQQNLFSNLKANALNEYWDINTYK